MQASRGLVPPSANRHHHRAAATFMTASTGTIASQLGRPHASCQHPPMGPQSEVLLVWRDTDNNTCVVALGKTWEQRAPLTGQQMVEATAGLPPFGYLRIGIGDFACDDVDLAYAVPHERCRARPIPDYIFTAWPTVGIASFDAASHELARIGGTAARSRVCGWAGTSSVNKARGAALAIMRRPRLEPRFAVHDVKPLKVTSASRRVSLAEQVQNWSCLVDVVGRGYSGRVPLLLHTGRPLLYVERAVRSFYDTPPHAIEPWTHYVPVRADLSDLEERAAWILTHPDEAHQIARAAQAHARRYLTRDAAISALRSLLLQALADQSSRAEPSNGEKAEPPRHAAPSIHSSRPHTLAARQRPISMQSYTGQHAVTTRHVDTPIDTPQQDAPHHDHLTRPTSARSSPSSEPSPVLCSARTIAGRRRCGRM